jgi:hypothetical protein
MLSSIGALASTPSLLTMMKSSVSIAARASQFFALIASYACRSLASMSACVGPAGAGLAAALALALALALAFPAPVFVLSVVVVQADAARSSAASASNLFMAGTPPKGW